MSVWRWARRSSSIFNAAFDCMPHSAGASAAVHPCVFPMCGAKARNGDDADGRKGKVGGFPPSASRKWDVTANLRGIIHVEFDRAWCRLPAHALFPFQLDVRIDLIVAEYVAAGEE